jgi:para-aminobenzoate synthetase component 1
MVVDLVRNDLCMICETDSVVVDELASIKSFPGLHHLVSTVSGTLIKDDISDIIKATFPMASMTGIPKKSMITLMNSIEKQPRGIYSGSIGYKKPNGDFDFNVVIRTFLYNSIQQSASISTGGAITSMSNAKDEYLECITKVSRLLKTIHPELDLSSLSSI